MRGGQDGEVGVVEQVQQPYALGVGPARQYDDREVGPALPHGRERVVGVDELQLDLDAGVLGAQPGDGGGHQGGTHRGEVPHGEPSRAPLPQIGQRGLRLRDL